MGMLRNLLDKFRSRSIVGQDVCARLSFMTTIINNMRERIAQRKLFIPVRGAVPPPPTPPIGRVAGPPPPPPGYSSPGLSSKKKEFSGELCVLI